MRILIFLFCTTVFSLTPEVSFSQDKVIINRDQSMTVDQVFNIIQQQTNYHFIFPKRLFKNSPNISLQKGEILVTDLLKKSLNNSNLEFQVDENGTILIQKIEASRLSQNRVTISGTISDSNGIALPGVTIIETGTGTGTTSDFSGNYSITVANDAIVDFSYLGYKTESLKVADLTYFSNINIVLKEELNSLEEVVVTGYQQLSRERTAGSFSKVNSEQLEQRPSSPNIIDRLAGQVSGLNINPVFGSFEIRGRSTIFGSQANPLIVVDGFPLADQQNLNSINPEDVESITILKDASASSIWGSRASNGVVVVVTKTGAKNQPLSVTVSSFAEIEDKVDLDNMDWMSTSQEIDLDMEFIDKGWTNLAAIAGQPGSINDLHLAYIYRNGLSPDGNVWSQNTFDSFVNQLRQRNINDEWEKHLLRSAMRTTHNLSISGGGEKNSFYGSLSYTELKEQSIGNQNDRITMNLRNVFDFNDKISFTAGMTAVLRNVQQNALTTRFGFGDGGSIDAAGLVQPYERLFDDNGQYVQKYYDWNPWVSRERADLTGSPYTFNFVEEQRNRDLESTLLDVRADFLLDVEIFKDLTLSSSFRYERNTNDLDNFKNMTLPSWRNRVNDFYVFDSQLGRYVNNIPVGSEYLQERSYSKGWVFKNTLTWDKNWGEHDLTLFAGTEYSRRFNETLRNRKFGYDKQTTNFLPINEVDLLSRRILNWNGESFSDYFDAQIFAIDNLDNRFVSGFANLGYTFKDTYTLNGSFRIDQANIYGSNPDFRYKPLWSVGAAWNLDNEAFLQDATWINRLKLRASYGLGGNSINSASPFPTARNRNINWGNPYITLVLSQPGNPDLKWEETATTDFGIDFSFFQDRISGSLDYYYKKSTDVYTSRSLDPTVGFPSSFVNYADIDNEGFELVLNADIIRTDDFKWSVRTNFNTNRNELVTFKANGTPSADSFTAGNGYEEGRTIAGMYGYNFAGLDENGEVLLFDADGNTKLWNESVEVEELVYKGTRIPKNYGGLSTTLNYKGLDLTVNMNYQAGFYFRKSYNYASTGYGTYNNWDYDFSNIRVHEEWANRWMQPGDEATTTVPKIFYNGLNPESGNVENRFNTASMHRIWSQSTRNIHKGDYLRVQDIILGYSMPQKFLKSTFFNSLRVTMQVSNPFLFVANDLGVDPTAPESEAYTNLTRYTFGVRANF